jgi:hypothetical protein
MGIDDGERGSKPAGSLGKRHIRMRWEVGDVVRRGELELAILTSSAALASRKTTYLALLHRADRAQGCWPAGR